jgi:hypothetical protein
MLSLNADGNGEGFMTFYKDQYNKSKGELEQLLELIRDAQATLEDARERLRTSIAEEKAELESYRRQIQRELEENRVAMTRLAEEKSQGFPWLAKAYSDFFYLLDLRLAQSLEVKVHPAVKAAEQVREIAAKRKSAEQAYRVLRYQLEYYENLFPWLIDFKGEELDDLIRQVVERKEAGEEAEEVDDAAKKWLTAAEYTSLPRIEKYQLALDRYWHKKKSKWELGRDYERYVGYLYEKRGYAVHYQGIVEGLADLGRDLVCTLDHQVKVIQCKYWSKEKQIHEKHVFQLYGTLVAYRIDHPLMDASACFITSTELSPRARQFADALGIEILEQFPLERYPCVKCNISRRDGTKIYHLPLDQQYDRTIIEEERNECYAETIVEAERLGFRRAFRWRGEVSE